MTKLAIGTRVTYRADQYADNGYEAYDGAAATIIGYPNVHSDYTIAFDALNPEDSEEDNEWIAYPDELEVLND